MRMEVWSRRALFEADESLSGAVEQQQLCIAHVYWWPVHVCGPAEQCLFSRELATAERALLWTGPSSWNG